MLDGIPTPGRAISWEEISTAEIPVLGATRIDQLPALSVAEQAQDGAQQLEARQVTFTDAEGDQNCIKLRDNVLAWYDAATQVCFLRPVTRLTYRSQGGVLSAPERPDLLVSQLGNGPESMAVLQELADMAASVDVALDGFPVFQVSFVDAEGDGSTLKFNGTALSWHDSTTDECFLNPIASLRYRQDNNTIIAPERADFLQARLVQPAAGAERDELLRSIVEMATIAGVALEGFAAFTAPTTTLSVSFVDAEGDGSTLKFNGTALSWHDSTTDECFLNPIASLRYRQDNNTIIAPERADFLQARLVQPAAGAERDELLRSIVEMATIAGVALEGFAIIN